MSTVTKTTVDKVMAESRAASFTKRSIKSSTKLSGLKLALSMVDLTTLEGKDTPEKVRSLCRKAASPGDGMALGELPTVAAVCVYPTMVAAAKKELTKLGVAGRVKIASVATGFPSGQYTLRGRLDDVRRAVDAGADEIDMVISRGAFLSGDRKLVHDEIAATVEACGWAFTMPKAGARKAAKPTATKHGAHLKVILETGELETLDNARQASDLAIEVMHGTGLTSIPGAGFIKTSTGKVEPAATMPVTLVMLEAIRDHWLATGELVGMKPAGGIRNSKSALHYLVMLKETLGTIEDGAYLSPDLFRFGASALVNDLCRQIAWMQKGRYSARYDFAEA
ncbi:MAG: 2-deoxyribose-5-phosphate aldolase [Phycisphaerales bacterium]